MLGDTSHSLRYTQPTPASVVLRGSVRVAFLSHRSMADLDITTADIRNAYLNVPCKEKVYIVCGPEFGKKNEGKVSVIVR